MRSHHPLEFIRDGFAEQSNIDPALYDSRDLPDIALNRLKE